MIPLIHHYHAIHKNLVVLKISYIYSFLLSSSLLSSQQPLTFELYIYVMSRMLYDRTYVTYSLLRLASLTRQSVLVLLYLLMCLTHLFSLTYTRGTNFLVLSY